MLITADDLSFLKGLQLWTGCRSTPYIMRSGIDFDKCLIYITNLRQSWVCKLEKEQIVKDKENYNKSIQTTSFQGILDLLQMAISYDPSAEYTFQLNGDSLFYGYSNIIKIYTLTWVFDCKALNEEDHFSILKNDIFNPLLLTISSLETRCEYYKSAMFQVEGEYIRRLNDKEKQTYRAKDPEEDYKAYIKEDQISENKIAQVQFTPCTNYFIKYYALNRMSVQQRQLKKRAPQQVEQLSQQSHNKKDKILEAYKEALEDMFEGQAHKIQHTNPEKAPTKKKKGFL